MVVAFCSRLGWTYLHDLLKGFAARLAFGVRRELTELVSIEGLDASRKIIHFQRSNLPRPRYNLICPAFQLYDG
ncbi:hypothetical protein OESDEN_05341 [Oesophagostomum dentatum]|uniref:Uncharacterized protein n=1 Tax=Oesophagostomum dentatum TaxID=61180 RepID=A0A0B1TB00_OESDE|nr:hypothetical protein OESDEN_05341 [Oesophagostomum dentatum]